MNPNDRVKFLAGIITETERKLSMALPKGTDYLEVQKKLTEVFMWGRQAIEREAAEQATTNAILKGGLDK